MDEKRANEVAGILARGLLRTQLPRLGDSRWHGHSNAKEKEPAAGADALHKRQRNLRPGGAS
jgi:hypothetical protein